MTKPKNKLKHKTNHSTSVSAYDRLRRAPQPPVAQMTGIRVGVPTSVNNHLSLAIAELLRQRDQIDQTVQMLIALGGSVVGGAVDAGQVGDPAIQHQLQQFNLRPPVTVKKKTVASVTPKLVATKRKMTAAGREKISMAMRDRWARIRAAQAVA